MIHRELNNREKEILQMIRPTTFYDIVEAVRIDVEHSRYNAKKELRILRNDNYDRDNIGNGYNSVNNGINCKKDIKDELT